MMGRSSLFFLFVLVLLFPACQSDFPHDTPTTLGESIFKVLQNGDRAKLERFVPKQDDVYAALEKAETNPKRRKKSLELLTRDWDRLHKEMTDGIHNSWDGLFSEMSDAGVDLKAASFVSAVGKIDESGGFIHGDIDVLFDYDGVKYGFRILDAGKTPRGWLISRRGFSWLGRS